MRTSVKLTGYALGLVLVFGAAAGAGRVLGPEEAPEPAHTDAHAAAGSDAQEEHGDHLPGGLQVTQDGYRLAPVSARLGGDFAFRILGPDGRAVTKYVTNHDKDLHLIVVRRDLAGFQHVHPVLGADGIWRIPLKVDAPGQYRVFADFQPEGHEQLTLGVDVPAPGDYQPVPLPAPAVVAEVDGYLVTLGGELAANGSSELTFAVAKGGKTVTDLEPYLGAAGHLVALRDGDLAYLHVHPTDEQRLAFTAEVPSAGVYRLYLDFKHGGKVRTAEFTMATAGVEAPRPTAATTPAHDADGHTHD